MDLNLDLTTLITWFDPIFNFKSNRTTSQINWSLLALIIVNFDRLIVLIRWQRGRYVVFLVCHLFVSKVCFWTFCLCHINVKLQNRTLSKQARFSLLFPFSPRFLFVMTKYQDNFPLVLALCSLFSKLKRIYNSKSNEQN